MRIRERKTGERLMCAICSSTGVGLHPADYALEVDSLNGVLLIPLSTCKKHLDELGGLLHERPIPLSVRVHAYAS
jgi:hypothetical protein